MGTEIRLGDIAVDVTFKDIKNVHLTVHPPAGRVRVAAPRHLSPDTVRVFCIGKLDWIRQQQKKLREQERETPREYIGRESHYVWGRRYLLTVVEAAEPARVTLGARKLELRVRTGASRENRAALVERWYREQVRAAVPALLSKWEPRLEVRAARFFVQRMKTRWGSCNPRARTIRFNTDLAKKPPECLEYIAVHELVHLLEPTHNARFVALMDRHLPNWREHRTALNRLPVRHEEWDY